MAIERKPIRRGGIKSAGYDRANRVLEIEFDNGSKMIINRHTAAREIWVAAKSGGFHFRPQDGNWVNTRGGDDLWEMLAALASAQAGAAVSLVRPA